LNPEEYETLLIVAGLAFYARYGFKMKPTARSEFIKGHQFVVTNDCPIEFAQKKIDLHAYINGLSPSQSNLRSFYPIRIGNKTKQNKRGRDGRRFCPGQNPFARATVREKANSCCNHPAVLAQADMMDARNKQNLLKKRMK
jgi:hypothetical protein